MMKILQNSWLFIFYYMVPVLVLTGSLNAQQLVTNGSFENTPPGVVDTSDVDGWVIEVNAAVSPAPELSI
ncbi:MAG: hypothetical protein EHM20_06970, partial [Alphaproteobacteria bacterium]